MARSAAQFRNARGPMTRRASQREMRARDVQSSKAPLPISITPFGRVREVSVAQPLNAPSPMAVTPSGTVTSPPAPL